ncbi:hypothetical protein [Streptomyces hokutonensis]|uniref:hypothetical protein n=1 Tax=Streptomyces hokutonensis TaxID=1306990 RepID=UPI00340F9595
MTATDALTADSALGERIQHIAREQGFAPALRRLGAACAGQVLPPGAGGHIMASEEAYGNRQEKALSHRWPLPGGAVVVSGASRPAADGRRIDQRLLLHLRLGLSEGLRDDCVAHLANRPSGDGTVLLHQMVKGQLAEALGRQLELGTVLASADGAELSDRHARHLHGEVTATSRALLRLLGARGYLMDGPGAAAHVSELLADLHLPAEESE